MASVLNTITREFIEREMVRNGIQLINETEDGYSLYSRSHEDIQRFPVHWDTAPLADLYDTLVGIGYIAPAEEDDAN